MVTPLWMKLLFYGGWIVWLATLIVLQVLVSRAEFQWLFG